MTEKSKENKLLVFLQDEYIDNGYLYSGSWPYNSLRDMGFERTDIDKLVTKGFLQRRNCEGLAYELSIQKRHQLLSQYSLCSRWLEKAGHAFMDSIREETQNVSLVKPSVNDPKMITVDTLKGQGDTRKPNKMDVSCPLSVGQIIQVEYDLPKQWKYTGYAHKDFRSGGVVVGKFMVTDVVCNLLVDPPMNMIELQSLSAEFNQIHPDARTMQLFEDVVLKRLKEPLISLEEQINDAASQCVKQHSSIERNKER